MDENKTVTQMVGTLRPLVAAYEAVVAKYERECEEQIDVSIETMQARDDAAVEVVEWVPDLLTALDGMRLAPVAVRDVLVGQTVAGKIDHDDYQFAAFSRMLTVETCRETDNGDYQFTWKGHVGDSFPYSPDDVFVILTVG